MKNFGHFILQMMNQCNEIVMQRKSKSLGELCNCSREDCSLISRALQQSWGFFLSSINPESCSGPALPFAIKLVGQKFERDFYVHHDERAYLERLVNTSAEALLENIDAILHSVSFKNK